MNAFQHLGPLQKLLHFGFQIVGYLATIGLVAFLVLAWILTAPFMRCGVYLSDLYHTRLNPK
jgi:hypothetical protein